jgi:hypothetical protein
MPAPRVPRIVETVVRLAHEVGPPPKSERHGAPEGLSILKIGDRRPSVPGQPREVESHAGLCRLVPRQEHGLTLVPTRHRFL